MEIKMATKKKQTLAEKTIAETKKARKKIIDANNKK